jgi:hypothetical protein
MLNTNTDASATTVSVVLIAVKLNVHQQAIHLEEKVAKWDVIALVVVHVITPPVCAIVSPVTMVQCAKRKLYWDKR